MSEETLQKVYAATEKIRGDTWVPTRLAEDNKQFRVNTLVETHIICMNLAEWPIHHGIKRIVHNV